METTSLSYPEQNRRVQSRVIRPNWQRIILLIVLGYEGAGALLGGALLVASPDGRYMDMPVDIMHGAFRDFRIPGMILFGLGILNTLAFLSVLRRARNAWVMTGLALGGLLIWFWVEIAILQALHWLHAMWGLPVVLGAFLSIVFFLSRKETLRKAALVCGILSSVLYLAINIIVPAQWPGYSLSSQTVSELSAIGAPTRVLWIVLCAPYTLLVIAFAWGVWKSAVGNRFLRISGVLLMVYGVTGILWYFAPMHLRETLAAGGGTLSDTMHIALAAITEIIYLLALGLTAAALGKAFRVYSVATFLALLVFGILTFLDSPGVATNQPTPFLGVWERINIGVFLLWVIVVAVILLREKTPTVSQFHYY